MGFQNLPAVHTFVLNTLKRDDTRERETPFQSLIKATADRLSDTHIILDIDVVHALVIELLLHVGDGCVVSRDSVDACILQPSVLHQLTTNLHNQGHELETHKKYKKCLALNQQHT